MAVPPAVPVALAGAGGRGGATVSGHATSHVRPTVYKNLTKTQLRRPDPSRASRVRAPDPSRCQGSGTLPTLRAACTPSAVFRCYVSCVYLELTNSRDR